MCIYTNFIDVKYIYVYIYTYIYSNIFYQFQAWNCPILQFSWQKTFVKFNDLKDAWAEHLWIFTLEHPSSIRMERRPATLRSVSWRPAYRYHWPPANHTTVDGRNFAPVEVGSLSHYLQGFIHVRWCRILSTNSTMTPIETSNHLNQTVLFGHKKLELPFIWPLSHRRFVASHDGEAACLQWWIHSKARQCVASGNNLSNHLQSSARTLMRLQTTGAPCSFSVTQVYKHIFSAQLFQHLSFQAHNVNQVSPVNLSEK